MTTFDPEYNTPIIQITDFNNRFIIIDNKDVCEFFESFTYKYVEGTDPDECEIAFSFPTVEYLSLPALTAFSQRKGIIVQWGYVDSLSAKRQVGIKDIKIKYFPKYIQFILICVPWTDFLLQIGAEPTATTVMDELLAAVKRGFELHYWLPDDLNKIRIYWDENKKFPEYVRLAGQTYYDFGKDLSWEIYQDSVGVAESSGTGDEEGPQAQAAGDADVMTSYQDINGTLIRDPFLNAMSDPDVRSGMLNFSLLDQIDYLLKLFSDSFICDCRDNILDIRTRKLNGDAHRVYFYEGEPGYLLSVELETRDKETDATNVSILGIDPDTGEINVTQTATTNTDSASLGYWFTLSAALDYGEIYQYIDGNFYVYTAGKHLSCAKITDSERVEELKAALERALMVQSQIAQTLPEIIKLIIEASKMGTGPADQQTPKPLEALENDPDPYLSELFWALREKILNPDADLVKILNIKQGFINGETSQWFEKNSLGSSPYTVEEIAAAAARQTIEDTLNRNWGEFTILGDPLLTSSMRFLIKGLHKDLSGAYYIEQCEHRIDKNGYIVIASGFRVPPLYSTVYNQYLKIVGEKMEKIKNEAYIHNRGEWEKLGIGEYDPLNQYIITDEAEDSLDDGSIPFPGGEGQSAPDIDFND